VELDVVGRLFGDASGKGSNLLVGVNEEGVGGPATNIYDGVTVNVVEELHEFAEESFKFVSKFVFKSFEFQGGAGILPAS
jgi:hypothetical protein